MSESKGSSMKSTGRLYLAPVTAAVKLLAIAGKGACVVHIHCLACRAVTQAAESHADTGWPALAFQCSIWEFLEARCIAIHCTAMHLSWACRHCQE